MIEIDGPDVQALDARWGRVPGVRFETRFCGPVAVLEAAGATAVVAIQGAQVLSWMPAGYTDDVLWLSPTAQLGSGKAVRGGVPVCWPWFGPHPSDAKKPAHGFVRAARWRVAGSAASARRSRLVMTFDTGAPGAVDADIWPSRAQAEIEITIGKTLTIALSTDNLSSMPFGLTQALHTYLAVGNISKVSVTGLERRGYVDQSDNNQRRVDDRAITFDREVDRIYQATSDDVVVIDRSFARAIRVAKSGSASTVIWNPWIDKAARLGDMGADGYRRMLCVEAANAGDDMVTLASRARHRLMTEISVEPL